MEGIQTAYRYIAGFFTRKIAACDVSTQTNPDSKSTFKDVSTQTGVSFTDRLTEFGTKVVGSSETYDEVCDICEGLEIKAVGHCAQCEQFMCLVCCRCHEKGKLTRHHFIVDKTKFDTVKLEKSLFQRKIVPISTANISGKNSFTPNTLSCVKKTGMVLIIGSEKNTKCDQFKVFSENKLIHECILPYECHSCIELTSKQNTILITVPKKTSVYMMNIFGDGKLTFCFSTSGTCYGITEFDNGLAILVNVPTGCSLPDWQIQFLNFDGSVKRRICYDDKGDPLLKYPDKDLISNYAQDLLYILDLLKPDLIVMCLNTMGEIMFSLKIGRSMDYISLSVDHKDYVYVLRTSTYCYRTGIVLQVKRDGKHRRVLFSKQGNVRMKCICYNIKTERLIVCDANGCVQQFAFLQ